MIPTGRGLRSLFFRKIEGYRLMSWKTCASIHTTMRIRINVSKGLQTEVIKSYTTINATNAGKQKWEIAYKNKNIYNSAINIDFSRKVWSAEAQLLIMHASMSKKRTKNSCWKWRIMMNKWLAQKWLINILK